MATKFKMTKLANGNIRSCEVRLSYPQLFQAVQGYGDDGKPRGKPQRSTVVLFPEGADLSVLDKEIDRVIKEVFPGKSRKSIKVWIHDQGEKDQEGYVDGAMYLKAASTKAVPVVGRDKEPLTEEDDAYPGVNAIVTFSVLGRVPKKGDTFGPCIHFGLQSVLVLGGGDRLGGGKPADVNEEFEGLDDLLAEGDSADSIFGDDEE